MVFSMFFLVFFHFFPMVSFDVPMFSYGFPMVSLSCSSFLMGDSYDFSPFLQVLLRILYEFSSFSLRSKDLLLGSLLRDETLWCLLGMKQWVLTAF